MQCGSYGKDALFLTPDEDTSSPNMIQRNFPPAFPLKHAQKDMRLALELGDQLAQPLPVAAAANEVMKAARASGHQDDDFSSVMAAIRDQK